MTRFNAISHLEAFEAGRGYPKIHDNLFNLIAETWTGGSVIDICCSTGLLGQRIIEKLGLPCCGIEGDIEAVRAAHMHGVQMKIYEQVIDELTLGLLARILTEHAVTTVVMRRCVSELFAMGRTLGVGNTVQKTVNADFAVQFVAMLLGAGVQEVYLQGRAETVSSQHVIPDVSAEIDFFLPHFEVRVQRGQCAYLRRVQVNENTDKKVA